MTTGAVMGATGTIKTMADGTFRVVVDIEPRFAQEAFRLFGTPGTPVELARLTDAAAVAQDRAAQAAPVAPEAVPEAPKGGALAKLAALFCGQEEFWRFLTHTHQFAVADANEAALAVRQICQVQSRAELDGDPVAAERFHRFIRLPYLRWQQGVR